MGIRVRAWCAIVVVTAVMLGLAHARGVPCQYETGHGPGQRWSDVTLTCE
jgi:hypothetical protein